MEKPVFPQQSSYVIPTAVPKNVVGATPSNITAPTNSMPIFP